jgi:hypothetical protein
MRFILFIVILFSSLISFAQNPCPIYGDKPLKKFQVNDSLKNRTLATKPITPSKIYQVSEFIDLHKSDTGLYNTTPFIAVEGYIVDVKWGGSETCNCHSKDKKDLDIHIEFASTSTEKDGKKIMVCELTRFTKGDLTVSDIKKYIGHKVKIYGYLFFDGEHWHNAVNTNPKGTNLWRSTCWEVHPVIKIEQE